MGGGFEKSAGEFQSAFLLPAITFLPNTNILPRIASPYHARFPSPIIPDGCQSVLIMKRVLIFILGSSLAWMTSACSPINVMGRNVSDREYIALYDAGIAREKSGLKPGGVHDEYGRVPSWNEYWRTIGGTNPIPPTAQSRRLKRYIIEHRRAAGLPELSGAPN